METLGDKFPQEQVRLRELLVLYAEIGPSGTFARTMIEDVLRRADKAAVEQDVIAMIALYQEMRGFTG